MTPGTEVQVDIAVGTVATNHPLSVTSNGIVVTTGTDPFVGTIQTKLAIDPTAWTNSANAGGNRLFIQSYWKKDGTIVEATRQDYYIRGDERYAPTEHLIVADATLELTAGTYTLFINKIGQAAAGNEINSIQINATSSNITVVSADYSGGDVMTGGDGGLDQAAVDARVTAGTKVFARSGGRNVRGGDIDSDTITAANLAPNSVGASELADDAVDSGAIADDAVTQAKIANDAVGADQIAANAVGSSEIATNAVTATEIANQTIVAGNIANDAVGNAQIATDAVRADQIQAGAVGSSEIAPNAVGASELADNAVDSGAIANLAVTEAKLASNAVSERAIQDDAVRAAQIQAGAVGTSELANDAVTAAKIDTDAVGSAEIAAGAVGTSELANNAVTPAQVHSTLASRLVPAGGTDNQILAKSADADYATEWVDAPSGGGGLTQSQVDARVQAGVKDYAETGGRTIQTADIGDTQITRAKIAAEAVGNSQILRNAVRTNSIETGAVTAAKIAANAVGATQLADNAVDTAAIANDAVTQAKIANNAVGVNEIADDAVSAAKIRANAVATASIIDDAVTDDKLANTLLSRLLPAGGADEQILAKSAAADYQVEWIDAPSGGGTGTPIDNVLEVIPFRTWANSTASTSNTTSLFQLPTNYADYDTLIVMAKGSDGASEENMIYRVPVVDLGTASGWVDTKYNHSYRIPNTSRFYPNQPSPWTLIWHGTGGAALTQRGITIDASFSASSTRPRIVYCALVSYTAVGADLEVSPLESTFTPSLAAATRATVGETQISITAGTIATGHPLTVTGNGIVVAAGTSPFQAMLDYVLEIDPTGWTSAADSGGNRLFFDVYWKKDGTILPDSRASHYIRGDEDWAPQVHKVHSNVTEILSPGTYTLWIHRSVAAGAGNEINAFQINAANSDIKINSHNFTGAIVDGGVPDGGTAGQVLTWPQTGSTPIWAAASGGAARVLQSFRRF